MKHLLESKDLLSELRVQKVYWLMVKKSRFGPHHIIAGQTCSKCKKPLREVGEGNCPVADSIPGSLADVAEIMRDKLCPEDDRWAWEWQLINILTESIGVRANSSYALRHATATQRIVAAVLISENICKAWEAKK